MTTMASMIYFDPDYGPPEQDVFDAARWSEGAPGRFLDRLQGIPFDRSVPRVLVVHESPVAYGKLADASGGEAIALAGAAAAGGRRSRIGSVLWRAGSRASALEARGRHAAAGRLLVRAARVLRGRGETALAARCWLQLAWMARTRGALDRAHDCAAQAAAADSGAECQIQAGCVRAVCWTDAERFEEAGGALRDLVVAATTSGNSSLVHASQLALARVRLWAGRPDEAAAIVEPMVGAEDPETACAALALKARARLASADLAGALQAARAAIGRLPAAADGRIAAAAHRVMAEALCEAGDLPQLRLHVREGLDAAAAARLPLQALRLRAMLVRGLRACDGGGAERVALGVMRVRRRGVPPLVERFLLRHLDDQSPADKRRDRTARTPRPAPFEDFLDLSHRAGSDHEAIAGVLSAVCARLDAAAAVVVASDGRICAAAGKTWGDRARAQEAALLSGQRVMVDGTRQPPEAAEPIRCAGQLLGVLACRWIAGATAEPIEVAESLHAAGLAVAAHLRALLEQVPAPPASVWGDLLGDSALAASLRDDIHRAARAPFPVLIEGESGSGKELVARAVHRLSPRHARRFCAINCAALSDELLEAELFGHTRGAFTGALTERAGLFEEADGGTLFLDEVGELSARAQAKLLRVLQEGEVRRIGENLPRRVDVRIVAATNRRLEGEAASGRFRTDLRFRLDVLRIAVPPLRERVDDIAMLAQHFWKQAVARVGSQATLGSDALAALSRYDWPGNVRELQNAIAWMAVHAPRRGRVGAAVLPSQLASAPLATGSSFELAREEFERRYVRAALAQAGGHRVGAAKALGVSRQGLAKMMRRLRIEER
jgi:DNA-binding NtrC family response regulator/tetratricopeptide (TPR) repeat protein